jgi:hypothetical protein
METVAPKTISLEPSEMQFLVEVLKASAKLLTIIVSLQQSIPGLSPPPLDDEAITNVAALAEKIEQQISK